jgi:polysaccharide biosynthesis protein PelD
LKLKETISSHLGPFGNPWAIGGETLMLPLLAVGIGIWANPLDPLWVKASFPWAWFAPIILAMRYGPFPGLGGASVLLFAWLGFSASGWIGGEFPKLNFLGGLILVMLAGEFSSLWLARARRAEGVQFYLDQRLEYLTHQYYLLRLSHDRLEQDLIGRPMAMRDALTTLQRLISEQAADEAAGRLPGAAGLLRLLAQYCQLESAALYAMHAGSPYPQPVAIVGKPAGEGRLEMDDPLLREVMETETLSHVAQTTSPASTANRYVIAAPLKNIRGELIGMLVVERVPFFALHEEMLQTLNLLVNYYIDGLETQWMAAQVQRDVPACPDEFAAELLRLRRVRDESSADSVITALEFLPGPELDDLATQLRGQRRALDVNWLIDSPQRKVLATLMPLAGRAAAEGYIARVEEWVRHKSGKTLTEAGVFPHILHVGDLPPGPLLNKLFDICNVPAEARTLRADA